MKYTVTSEHSQRELNQQGTIGILLGSVGLAFGPIGWLFTAAAWYTAYKKFAAAKTVMDTATQAGEEA